MYLLYKVSWRKITINFFAGYMQPIQIAIAFGRNRMVISSLVAKPKEFIEKTRYVLETQNETEYLLGLFNGTIIPKKRKYLMRLRNSETVPYKIGEILLTRTQLEKITNLLDEYFCRTNNIGA